MSHFIFLCILFLGIDLSANVYYYSFGKKVALKPLHETRNIGNTTLRYYEFPTGEKVGVKQEIIIGCKDFPKCKKLLEKYPIISTQKLSDKLYLIKLSKDSNPFEIANELYHKEEIFLSHPNFVRERKLR